MNTASPTSGAEPSGPFESLAELRAACLDLPEGDSAAAAAVMARQAELTKPPGSLGRLEEIVAWLAKWGRNPPRLDRVDILVFAGNHGVTAQGVSPFRPRSPRRWWRIFAAAAPPSTSLRARRCRDAARHPARSRQADRRLYPEPAMDEAAFLTAVATGYRAVRPDTDLICLGEMGIGNTTAAAAIAAALFGGDGARWAGRGTGVDDAVSPASAPRSTKRSHGTPT